jgi:hypothetical protein
MKRCKRGHAFKGNNILPIRNKTGKTCRKCRSVALRRRDEKVKSNPTYRKKFLKKQRLRSKRFYVRHHLVNLMYAQFKKLFKKQTHQKEQGE